MDTASAISNVVGLVLAVVASVWVSLDARAIGSDYGRRPGIVRTKPAAWAGGVFLLLIVFLPAYLLVRVRYKRLLAERRAAAGPTWGQGEEGSGDAAGVWPPPPTGPAP